MASIRLVTLLSILIAHVYGDDLVRIGVQTADNETIDGDITITSYWDGKAFACSITGTILNLPTSLYFSLHFQMIRFHIKQIPMLQILKSLVLESTDWHVLSGIPGNLFPIRPRKQWAD